MTDSELDEILVKARAKNARLGITGILLYENGSFFQVLEGAPDKLDGLFSEISNDTRHASVAIIIREPIPKRAFAEWTMGYSRIEQHDLDDMIGLNDFFSGGASFTKITPGRAKKLLSAFRDGRWRSKVQYTTRTDPEKDQSHLTLEPATIITSKVSFSFQPIVSANDLSVIAYEAILKGANNEPFVDILPLIGDVEWSYFDTNCRAIAISMAARLSLPCDLHLSYVARRVEDARAAISTSLEAANKNGIEPSRIVLRIDQDKLIGEREKFAHNIEEYRGAGLRISIDHFGSGLSGLGLLELLRPEMISLNAQLIRDIDKSGSRQAILLGLKQTCDDLGIYLIANHVESQDEFKWLVNAGIELLQGNYIARPAFEGLPVPSIPQI